MKAPKSRFVFDFTFALAAIVAVAACTADNAFAWGKRGHEIVASIAAEMLVQKKNLDFLKAHEFDLGYYANVPDIIWRNLGDKFSELEKPQHFLDWGPSFEKHFASPKDLPVSFDEFKKTMGSDYDRKGGLAPYRIHQLSQLCKIMRDATSDAEKVKEAQAKLLTCLGLLSHYTGDLSNPMHVTSNWDGKDTGQAGLHVYFESDLVDFLDPEIKVLVLKKALETFAPLDKSFKNSDEQVRILMTDSASHLRELLAIDKKVGRKSKASAAAAYKKLLIDRLAVGAVTTALVWNEILGKKQSGDRFDISFVDGTPEYIRPDYEN